MRWALAVLASIALTTGFAYGQEHYGTVGGLVTLTVGYQPYSTQLWSGVVMRGKKLYEKYLPAGSQVEFQAALQGTIIVDSMLDGKQSIGYLGDMPAIVATTKTANADVRLVANLGLDYDQCNIVLARTDAPRFGNPKQALKWLGGKIVAAPKGSCADRFAQAIFQKEAVTPKEYLNQNLEMITSSFRAGTIDAAVIWEPTASRLMQEGLARRVASGTSIQERDGVFLAMRADLIRARPDVVKGWLNAELDAQLFLADPKNAPEIIRMAKAETTGFSERVLWYSLYGLYSQSAGGRSVRTQLHYAFTPEVRELIQRASAFLYSIKSIDVEQLRPDAIEASWTEQVLKERNVKAPIGDVKGLPDGRAPK